MSELGDSQLKSVAQPMLELRLASKAFGYVLALQEASSSAYAGEVIALVGDNGAGKSTMVKLLSGIHRDGFRRAVHRRRRPSRSGTRAMRRPLGSRRSSRTSRSSRS